MRTLFAPAVPSRCSGKGKDVRKGVIFVAVLSTLTALISLGERPTSATSVIDEAFDSRYGPALTNQFGCGLCHSAASLAELNPYGEDLADALAGGGGCLDFYPPNTHTIPKGRCEYLHADGLFTPFSSRCTTCHGVDLKGLIAPSCYLCHGVRWTETSVSEASERDPSPAQTLDDAFAAIENFDSDGDGYSNIAEIQALTHPGDANSFPGGEIEVSVDMDNRWDRSWITSAGLFTVTLKPAEKGSLDNLRYVSLKTDAGELYTTRIRQRGNKLEAVFPKALLHVLFGELKEKRATLLVRGKTASGNSFSAKFNVNQFGPVPSLLESISAKADPRQWEKGDDLTITLSNTALIETEKPIYLVTPFYRVKLEELQVSAKKITATLSADDVEKLLGRPVKDVIYTLGLYGSSTAQKTSFAVTVEVTAPTSDCYEFDPPPSHTVPLTRGECTYMHAPGYKTPYQSLCNICHGADLKGTSVTPSCYLCHGQLWTQSTMARLGTAEEEF
jgi:hypothetical protein